MKTKFLGCWAGLVLATVAHAGTSPTAGPPADQDGAWKWFAGGAAGYLFDLDEGMYGVRFGMESPISGNEGNHGIYLELGFTRDDAGFEYFPGIPGARTEEADLDLDIIPITLNYRYEHSLTGRLGWFFGLGAGIAIIDSSYDWSWTQATAPPGLRGGRSEDETDVRIYANVFAGLTCDLTDSLQLFGGLRYIAMDDKDYAIDVPGSGDYEGGINGDVMIELGLSYRF